MKTLNPVFLFFFLGQCMGTVPPLEFDVVASTVQSSPTPPHMSSTGILRQKTQETSPKILGLGFLQSRQWQTPILGLTQKFRSSLSPCKLVVRLGPRPSLILVQFCRPHHLAYRWMSQCMPGLTHCVSSVGSTRYCRGLNLDKVFQARPERACPVHLVKARL